MRPIINAHQLAIKQSQRLATELPGNQPLPENTPKSEMRFRSNQIAAEEVRTESAEMNANAEAGRAAFALRQGRASDPPSSGAGDGRRSIITLRRMR